jgi:hypothetical protein
VSKADPQATQQTKSLKTNKQSTTGRPQDKSAKATSNKNATAVDVERSPDKSGTFEGMANCFLNLK